jgi:3-oxoacyl-(acyl-carrier-protein) synthase
LPRPFDADRCGSVLGEGSGAFVLESREFAEARGAKIYATIRGWAEWNEPALHLIRPTSLGIKRSIELALQRADRKASDVGFVNPDGLGVVIDDRIEAEAIRETLGDVPVSATKGNFGELGSGTGAVELAAAVLALQNNIIPPTRNHENPAPDCPINVVHREAATLTKKSVLKLNKTRMGRAFSLYLEGE